MQLNLKYLILCLCVVGTCASCRTNSPIASYIATEGKDSIRVSLQKVKLPQRDIANIYEGVSRLNWNSRAKTFTDNRLKTLRTYQSVSTPEFWSAEDARKFGVSGLMEGVFKPVEKNHNLLYSFSEPIYVDNGKQAVFRVVVVAGYNKILFDGLAIMEKRERERKWKLVEKVFNSAVH